MAQQKNTQSSGRSTKKTAASGRSSSASVKRPVAKQNKAQKNTAVQDNTEIPVRLITAAVFASLFVVSIVMLFNPEGALVKLLYSFVLGMVGKIGFYMSIPVLLYLFIIHAFSAKRPVIMRSICLGCLIVCFGCIAHLFAAPDDLGSGFVFIGNLYRGGIDGTTGGLLCGLIAEFLDLLFAVWLSYIILIVAAAFTLLGALQITIPSLVRAFENRPRGDWEQDEAVDQPEPASIVVNTIANKRIERIENQRKAKEAKKQSEVKTQPEEPAAVKKTREEKKDEPRHSHRVAEEKETDAAPAKPHPEPLFIMPEVDQVPSNMPPLDVDAPVQKPAEGAKKKVSSKDAEEAAAQVAAEIEENDTVEKLVYQFPPIELLNPSKGRNGDATAEMKENADRLNDALESFGIGARISNVTLGPTVTLYEVQLEKGTIISSVTSRANDLASSLGVDNVRIFTVVGKISVVGIEVPNRTVTSVSLREVIDSANFTSGESKSTFAVGKDIGGTCVVGNIAKLPHMLIAGTTGSGKSVCMNSIIISLLYKASPDDVKMIMIDPKMVELKAYSDIPHLLIPVVTDPKKAAGSLQWAVMEMMRRYKSMSELGVRDLESYNAIMESRQESKMPQIVVIIDELADLMLVAAKDVEESICRIAQMGRASGIHLIIATQRPSAKVITGLMKANIPSRIAFAVASAMESRIILDTSGAEKLVGKGDMLYSPIGCGKPLRVQGCFVSESEVEAVTTFVKEHFVAEYDDNIIKDIEQKSSQSGKSKGSVVESEPISDELEGDEMLPAAVDVILETGQASVSMLQRRLKLGYARAARIVDEMEEKGIVGPYQGSKPRAILVTKEQWEAMKSGQNQQMTMDDMDFSDMPEDFE